MDGSQARSAISGWDQTTRSLDFDFDGIDSIETYQLTLQVAPQADHPMKLS